MKTDFKARPNLPVHPGVFPVRDHAHRRFTGDSFEFLRGSGQTGEISNEKGLFEMAVNHLGDTFTPEARAVENQEVLIGMLQGGLGGDFAHGRIRCDDEAVGAFRGEIGDSAAPCFLVEAAFDGSYPRAGLIGGGANAFVHHFVGGGAFEQTRYEHRDGGAFAFGRA